MRVDPRREDRAADETPGHVSIPEPAARRRLTVALIGGGVSCSS
jgi:hypothetical protein